MNYINNESGAVTVDWVVLTAALVGLGLATMGVVSQGVEDTATDIDTQLKADGIIKTAFGTGETCPAGVQDCGTNFFPWISGSLTTDDGTEYYYNEDGVLVDHDTGEPLPIITGAMDPDGFTRHPDTFLVFDYPDGAEDAGYLYWDQARRLVNEDGEPWEG